MKMAKKQQKSQQVQLSKSLSSSMPKPTAPSFDQWYTQQVGQKVVKADMKEAIKLHMNAYGFLKNNRFQEGLNHFGIKAK